MLLKDRCIGVFDLESPELDAFTKHDIEFLTLLASQAAVAIENARLYETVRANEVRLEKEMRFAQRVQAALLPTDLPKRLKGVDVAARFAPARELGGDLHDFLSPEPNSSSSRSATCRARACRRRSTACSPASWCGRGRSAAATCRIGSAPAGVLSSMNTILHQRQLEEYYCTLCYAVFDLKRRIVTLANSGLPYPIRCVAATDACRRSSCRASRLDRFPASPTTRSPLRCTTGDLFVFCSDGVFEAMNAKGQEFTAARLIEVVGRCAICRRARSSTRSSLRCEEFRGDLAPNDDMTAVAVRITT